MHRIAIADDENKSGRKHSKICKGVHEIQKSGHNSGDIRQRKGTCKNICSV